jgi:hypothetical protein
MRITEILSWNNEPTERNRSDPQPGLPSAPFIDDLTNLANAFTRSGLVKRGWNTNRWEGQPSRPAPPDAENELIPRGTLEPTTASWEAKPVEQEPQWSGVGSFRFGNSGAGQPPTRKPRDTSDGRDVVNRGTNPATGHARRSAVLAALPHP